MKITKIFSVSLTLAAETSNTAIFTLNYLEKVSNEIFSIESIKKSSSWKKRWTKKFRLNSDRLRGSFERCEIKNTENYEEINIDYDSDNHCGTIKRLTTEFSNWADRYISSGKCQKKLSNQKNRMKTWNDILHKGNGFFVLLSEFLNHIIRRECFGLLFYSLSETLQSSQVRR